MTLTTRQKEGWVGTWHGFSMFPIEKSAIPCKEHVKSATFGPSNIKNLAEMQPFPFKKHLSRGNCDGTYLRKLS